MRGNGRANDRRGAETCWIDLRNVLGAGCLLALVLQLMLQLTILFLRLWFSAYLFPSS